MRVTKALSMFIQSDASRSLRVGCPPTGALLGARTQRLALLSKGQEDGPL